MNRFATEFPVSEQMTAKLFIQYVQAWLDSSPHSQFEGRVFQQTDHRFKPNHHQSWKMSEQEELSYIWLEQNDFIGVSVQYVKHETNISFTTQLTFAATRNSHQQWERWIGCQISNLASTPNTSLPKINKPKIINMIIQDGLGGNIGLPVNHHIHEAHPDEAQHIASLMRGDTQHHLPMIYISLNKTSQAALSEEEIGELANKLAGMAHIVLEPSLAFSRELSACSEQLNAFGGYIGVYWSGGKGRNRYFNHSEKENLLENIQSFIFQAVSESRSLEICTRAYIQNRYHHYHVVQNQESSQLMELANDEIQILETKIKQMEEKYKLAESEIKRLQKELNTSNRNNKLPQANSQTVILNTTENELHPNEISETILSILKEARQQNDSMARRLHIIDDILAHNTNHENGKKLKENIKKILSQYTQLDSKSRQQLENLGFTVEQGGKHYKLIFQNDKRYTLTLSRSGSDKKGGMSAATDFCRNLGLK